MKNVNIVCMKGNFPTLKEKKKINFLFKREKQTHKSNK